MVKFQRVRKGLFFFFLQKKNFILFIFIVVQLQLSVFTPHHSPPPQPNPPSSLASTPSLGFVHVSFIVIAENPSLHYPFPPPFWLLSDCSSFQSLRLYFVCFFSFVDYVPVKGEIIWYLSLTTWIISLSIMLFSSIHAVAKGISSFLLSAA